MEPSALKIVVQGVLVGFAIFILTEIFRLELYPYVFTESIFEQCLLRYDTDYCLFIYPYTMPVVIIFVAVYWLIVFTLNYALGYLGTSSYQKDRLKNILMLSITAFVFGGGIHSFITPNVWYIGSILTFGLIFLSLMLGSKYNNQNQQEI
jgi:hypothetical protein